MDKISAKDIDILRSLAQRQMELANTPQNLALVREWEEHNSFRQSRPMVHLEMATFEREAIAPQLRCEGEEARNIEIRLWRNIANNLLVGDDSPVIDHYTVYHKVSFDLFGFFKESGGDGQQFLNNFQACESISELGKTVVSISRLGSKAEMAQVQEIFGDILPAKIELGCINAVPTQMVARVMGADNMLIAMLFFPDKFKDMMNRIADDYLSCFHLLEEKRMITPTRDAQALCQGSFCCSQELPAGDGGKPLSTKDIWAYMDSQETSGVKPEMFGEFVFPSYKRLAENFSHLSYGCCEPVDSIWDQYISAFPSVKKVSIAPSCNERIMGERLRGQNIIYHRKPNPSLLGTRDALDEDAVKAHIKETLDAASGCKLEISQMDVFTIGNDLGKAKRYVEVIRETIEENWKG
jgi:hypothetical protein